MPRIVRCGLIQASNALGSSHSLPQIKKAMIEKHLKLIEQAARKKVQVLSLQELFYGPYFCAEQNVRWYQLTERVPEGPTIRLMQKVAARHRMGYPVFDTKYGRIGVYICYDRHFPEGARILGLNGAEVVFNPSATVAGLSEYLWELEQPAHAVANGYFVGAINRVGKEKPWSIGEFYGKSYFCNPRGKIIAQASRNKDEVLVANLDLDMIQEVRTVWQFFRDRRPETYSPLTAQTGEAAAAD